MLAAPAGAGGEGRAEDEGQRDGERDRGGVGHGEESVEGERKRDHEDAQVGVLRLEEGDGTRLDLRRASRRGGERVMGSGGGRVRCSVVERGVMGLAVVRWRMSPVEATHAVRGERAMATCLGRAGVRVSSWWPKCRGGAWVRMGLGWDRVG